MSNEKLKELEISRGVAILGVLLIHVTSQALLDAPVQSLSYPIYVALNRLGHFSVPTFIFLSGLVLFYRYFEHWHSDQSLDFYRKRLKYILLPYIIWSTFYFLFNRSFQLSSDWSLRGYMLDLITGGAEYHLYFIILIIQYYLLLPALFALLKKVNIHGGILIIIGVAIQVLFGLWNNKVHWFPDKSILFTTYITAFMIGCLVGKSYRRAIVWIQTHSRWLLTSTVVFLFLHLLFAELEVTGRPIDVAIKETVVHLFSISAALTILYAASLTWPKIPALLSAYGKYSLGIYFIHPAVLYIADKYLHVPFSSPTYHLIGVLRVVIVLIIPIGLVLIIKRYRWAWAIFGK